MLGHLAKLYYTYHSRKLTHVKRKHETTLPKREKPKLMYEWGGGGRRGKEGRRWGRRYKEGDFGDFMGETLHLEKWGKKKTWGGGQLKYKNICKWLRLRRKEWRGRCSRYYWSVGSGARKPRKPMGFLGPAHDESWSAWWHITFLSRLGWLEGKLGEEEAY